MIPELDDEEDEEEVESGGLPQAPAGDAEEDFLPLPQIPAEDLLAADGFQMVAFQECVANLGDEWNGKDEDPFQSLTLEQAIEKEMIDMMGTEEDFFDTSLSTTVTFQEDGNTLVLLDPAFDEPVTAKSLQYIHSKAYKVIAKKGLASTPPIQGCSLMYNKLSGHDSVFILLTTFYKCILHNTACTVYFNSI